jgi:hypothetical protein
MNQRVNNNLTWDIQHHQPRLHIHIAESEKCEELSYNGCEIPWRNFKF